MPSPTHPKRHSYLQRGIFDELKSFGELEARISALASKQERGEVFEVFAEAYLATLAVEKAMQVWPGTRVPFSCESDWLCPVPTKALMESLKPNSANTPPIRRNSAPVVRR